MHSISKLEFILCYHVLLVKFLFLFFALVGKEGTPFSVAWILLSVLLGAVAMLCKEQGITILVTVQMCDYFRSANFVQN